MSGESRVKKSLLNARINLICYFISILIAFFTRKIFLERLGTEFIGLTGTLQSLLGFLNLAELGVGSAIGYVLYKPIFDNNKEKINEIISVLGYIYRWIGVFICGVGLITSLFLPLIFSDTNFSWGVIYFGFYAYLAASLLGYFVNYKQALLSADQRNYVVTGYFQVSTFIKIIIQATLTLTSCSFYLFLLMELIFGIINSIVLQWKINRTYPWLNSEVKRGKLLLKGYPEIKTYVKQLFVHQIGGFVQFQLSPFLIYTFVSLPVVAIYGNYTLITQRIQSLLNAVLNSTSAGVGNLISEGNTEKIFSVYKELLNFRILAAGFCAICIYFLSNDFIATWLGDEYQLSSNIILLLCAQFFMRIVREVNDQFNFGYGLFYDTWAPLVESAIFVVASVTLGSKYGLSGILMGPIFSTFIIVYLWKPYLLFSKGFKISVFKFWFLLLRGIFVLAAASLLSFLFIEYILTLLPLLKSWWLLLSRICIFSLIQGTLSVIFFWIFIVDFRLLCRRFIVKNRNK